VSDLLEETSDIKWANLQRTQAGAILYFRVRLEVYGMPCAKAQTTWSFRETAPLPVLTLHHPEGPVLLELNAAPSGGLFRLLEHAFGPEAVSKVHV
jgi:hypothetical protein